MELIKNFTRKKLLLIVLLISAMLSSSLVSPTSAQEGGNQWLPFGPQTVGETPEITLISASAEEIEIHASMPGARFGETEIDGTRYLKLTGEGYQVSGQVGMPALPVLRRLIEVPLGAKVSLELLEVRTQMISLAGLGLRGVIVPTQPSQPKCGDPESAASPSVQGYNSAFFPEDILAITDDYIMRGHRIIGVEIRPVRYNARLAELDVASEISFRVKLDGSDMARTISEADRLNSAPFNRTMQSTVLNYNQGRPVVDPKTGERILIITADMFEAGLADFVTLKESQGFSVAVANLSTVGGNTTTAIKNYIKTQYQSANPPDYVILVGDYISGDPVGSLTNYTMRTASSYRTDLHYFTMDGETEFKPDIFYSRFPVRTAANLSAMINKYLAYNATAGDESWVKKIEFLASNDSGYYMVAERTHNYVINNYTLPLGYTGIFPNNPQPGGDKIYAITYGGTGANAVASMNDNRAMLVYSGHGATTYWDAPRVTQNDIRNMTGVAIPYVASHACITSDFNTGEAFSDTWVIEPVNGGLTFFGSSDSTYWDEDEVLEKAIFDSLYEDMTLDQVPSIAVMTQYGLQMVDNMSTSLDNYYRETYHIFGDPSLQILMKPKFPDFRMAVEPSEIKTCNIGSSEAMLTVTSVNEYNSPVNLTASAVSGFTTTFAENPITPTGSTPVTIAGDGTAASGTETLVISGTSGTLQHTAEIDISIFAPITSSPQLLTPANQSNNVSPMTAFTWGASANAETYKLQVATDEAFSNVVAEYAGITETTFTLPSSLATDTLYYWRVYAENICGSVVSAQVFNFRTSPGPGDCAEGTTKEQVFFDDFEAGLGDWQNPGQADTFNITTVRAYSPVNSVLAGVPNNLSDQRLISPAISVPETVESASLIFWHRWTFDDAVACNDGAILEASINGGTTWTQVAKTSMLTSPYNGTIRSGQFNPIAGKQAWCFGTEEWVRTVVDLTPYYGETVQFRFRLGTGITGGAEGWYIDDVAVQSCVASSVETYTIYLPLVLAGE